MPSLPTSTDNKYHFINYFDVTSIVIIISISIGNSNSLNCTFIFICKALVLLLIYVGLMSFL